MKSPTVAICHCVDTCVKVFVLSTELPFISQITRSPVEVFCHTISGWPSPLKSVGTIGVGVGVEVAVAVAVAVADGVGVIALLGVRVGVGVGVRVPVRVGVGVGVLVLVGVGVRVGVLVGVGVAVLVGVGVGVGRIPAKAVTYWFASTSPHPLLWS